MVHHLGLAGRAKGHSVEIDKLALDIDEVEAQLQANVELEEDYPISAQLERLPSWKWWLARKSLWRSKVVSES